ncbi:MAG: TatD family hydrolase [Candidatus Aenigmarchaeota archaeon]|nr:TatD family hydrolase [Candidatus Aenigmarchaeota archaeon]
MIDSHCHLEQKDYNNDLDKVIELCKKEGLKALVTVCADPNDFERSLEIVDKYKNYVFLCAAIHPQDVKKFTQKKIDAYFDLLKENKKKLVAVGETGGDYFWIKEESWREKQKELFIQHIDLSKELKLPLVVHCRDAWEDVLKILEQEDVKKALLHLWGNKELIPRVVEDGYSITIGPLIARSKKHKEIVKNMPIESILLETDSPWFGQNGERGVSTNIRIPCEYISGIKKMMFEDTWKKCCDNAVKFFNLKL